MHLGEAFKVIGLNLLDRALIDNAGSDDASRDQLAQNLGGDGIELVVIGACLSEDYGGSRKALGLAVEPSSPADALRLPRLAWLWTGGNAASTPQPLHASPGRLSSLFELCIGHVRAG